MQQESTKTQENDQYCKIDGLLASELLRDKYSKDHPKMLLAFSCGKDAIGAWLAMRDMVEVMPYYNYLIPGLEFVEESLMYYERFFGCKIIRLPHEAFWRWQTNMTFCPPARCAVIEQASFGRWKRKEMLSKIREWKQLPEEAPCISGVRAADSIMRRVHFVSHGAYNKTEGIFYPIWDWKINKLKAEIVRSGIKLPVDYLLFGRSFDGLDYRFLKQIKEHFPGDYARILEYFPLAELELYRKEFSEKTY